MQRRENDKGNGDRIDASGDNLEDMALDPHYEEEQFEFETRLSGLRAISRMAGVTASLACVGILLIIGFAISDDLPHRGWLIALAVLPIVLAVGYGLSYRWLATNRFSVLLPDALTLVLFVLLGIIALTATKPIWFLAVAFFIPLFALTLSPGRWLTVICSVSCAVIYLATFVWRRRQLWTSITFSFSFSCCSP